MKVLITGATGGLGQNLTLALLQRGDDVIATGRNKKIGANLQSQGAKFIAASLEDTNRVGTLCRGVDTVFHCAALSSPWGSYHDFYNANVVGTENIIAGCLQNKVARLVHVSTPSIYFNFSERVNIKENAPLPEKPASYYAATKLIAEKLLDKAFQEQGLPFIAIRPRAIFGPHDQTIVPRLLRASKNGRVPLIASGRALVDATYVENVITSLLLCADAPSSCLGKKYNISNGEPLTFKDLVTRIFTALELPCHPINIPFPVAYSIGTIMELIASLPGCSFEPVMTRYSAATFAFSQTLDISAAKQELGYVPHISLQEGMQRFAQWWWKKEA